MSKNKDGLSLEIFRPALKRIIPIKPRINIGGKFDHYNGQWFTGKYGESILNGGRNPVDSFPTKKSVKPRSHGL